ncbi:hypothetical protein T01_4416 [Trichinella spiralis]|uniref:Uncharacterized protein n=1 Tax=Trichinella spiralis TaxID=6334 RepID=A0A0V1ARS5_TRISP|nr:hypothetical protein T01_4416 [Trichinella spiralis]
MVNSITINSWPTEHSCVSLNQEAPEGVFIEAQQTLVFVLPHNEKAEFQLDNFFTSLPLATIIVPCVISLAHSLYCNHDMKFVWRSKLVFSRFSKQNAVLPSTDDDDSENQALKKQFTRTDKLNQ